jgi:hypothetical protein
LPTLLFIHGTGVRKASYISTLAMIQRALTRHGLSKRYQLEACLWGDALGALPAGRSIPGRPRKSKRAEGAFDETEERARWELLYQDPWFEILLLVTAAEKPRSPSPAAEHVGRALYARILACEPSKETLQILNDTSQESVWRDAYRAVVEAEPTIRLFEGARDAVGEPAQAAARAIVALMTVTSADLEGVAPAGHARDLLVNSMVRDWDAEVGGIATTLTKFFLGVAATTAQPVLRSKRRDAMDSVSRVAGDVLVYQARGDVIRSYIKRRITECGEDVVVLAHSLGGVACVDMLARSQPPVKVTHLITCGSQAPYFHELGALWGLAPGATQLPDAFPAWLNVYDEDDLLSYVASPVFANSNITDLEVKSRQPFPYSHGAYWANDAMWKKIRSFLS